MRKDLSYDMLLPVILRILICKIYHTKRKDIIGKFSREWFSIFFFLICKEVNR